MPATDEHRDRLIAALRAAKTAAFEWKCSVERDTYARLGSGTAERGIRTRVACDDTASHTRGICLDLVDALDEAERAVTS